jgi:hypothetical protein
MRHSISLEDAEKARLLVMASIVRLRVAERARGRRG